MSQIDPAASARIHEATTQGVNVRSCSIHDVTEFRHRRLRSWPATAGIIIARGASGAETGLVPSGHALGILTRKKNHNRLHAFHLLADRQQSPACSGRTGNASD